MENNSNFVLVIIAIIVPLVIYYAVAFSIDKREALKPEGFFEAFKSREKNPFLNSSIAYGLQIATAFYFLYWVSTGQLLAPIINAICWGIGLFLFSLVISRLKDFLAGHETLHGYISNTFDSKASGFIASMLTVTGLMGVAFAEIYWGISILDNFSLSPDFTYFIVFGILFYIFFYVAYGGQLSSVKTDQAQLALSYIGLLSVSAFLGFKLLLSKETSDQNLTILMFILGGSVWILIKRRKGFFDRKSSKIASMIGNIVLFSLITINLVGITCLIIKTGLSSNHLNISVPGFSELGVFGVLSLVILPLGWQFVDMTQWQRIKMLRDESQDSAVNLKNISSNLRQMAIESPFSWIVILPVGIFAASVLQGMAGLSPLSDIAFGVMEHDGWIGNFVSVVFMIAIISVFLSTVDSAIIAVMYTSTYDIALKISPNKNTSSREESGKREINIGVILALLIAIVIAIGFFLLDRKLEKASDFITLLFVFYSAQMSLLPCVLFAIFKGKNSLSSVQAFSSILLGMLGGIGIGVYGIFEPRLAWAAVPVAVGFATMPCIPSFFHNKATAKG